MGLDTKELNSNMKNRVTGLRKQRLKKLSVRSSESIQSLIGLRAGRVRPAQLAIIKQMIGQVSRGSFRDYQADDQIGRAHV